VAPAPVAVAVDRAAAVCLQPPPPPPQQPRFEPDAACFAVCELTNESAHELRYERSVFFGGAPAQPPPPLLFPPKYLSSGWNLPLCNVLPPN
jgi:hypothetical protein